MNELLFPPFESKEAIYEEDNLEDTDQPSNDSAKAMGFRQLLREILLPDALNPDSEFAEIPFLLYKRRTESEEEEPTEATIYMVWYQIDLTALNVNNKLFRETLEAYLLCSRWWDKKSLGMAMGRVLRRPELPENRKHRYVLNASSIYTESVCLENLETKLSGNKPFTLWEWYILLVMLGFYGISYPSHIGSSISSSIIWRNIRFKSSDGG
ncbi:MAG: hypothetical protein P4L51_01840 [Puia sp.]|nr:hypothetical protein [Puia sp.]